MVDHIPQPKGKETYNQNSTIRIIGVGFLDSGAFIILFIKLVNFFNRADTRHPVHQNLFAAYDVFRRPGESIGCK